MLLMILLCFTIAGCGVTVTLTYLLRTEEPVVVVGYEALTSEMACAKVFQP